MGRSPCCDKQLGLKKGPWAPEEDKALVDYIQANGHGSWRSLPKLAGLRRCGKSCRLRWTNYLRPDIKRGPFTQDEQKSIIQLHGIVGNKWSTIAIQLPGRTDNEIKNYWNTHLKKRLLRMGINPETYSPSHTSPLSTPASSSPPATAATTSSSFSAARHMAQWESARLEAEARLSRESLLFSATLAASVTTASASTSPTDQTHLDDQQKKEPADFFLRMWNSDAGDSFRKKTERSNCQHQVKVDKEESSPGASSSCNTKPSSALTVSEANVGQRREEAESEETSDETYQFYLDLAAGDDELSLFNQSSHHHQLESCYSSLFSSDPNELASLDNSFK